MTFSLEQRVSFFLLESFLGGSLLPCEIVSLLCDPGILQAPFCVTPDTLCHPSLARLPSLASLCESPFSREAPFLCDAVFPLCFIKIPKAQKKNEGRSGGRQLRLLSPVCISVFQEQAPVPCQR